MGKGNNMNKDLIDYSYYIDTDGCVFSMDRFLKMLLKDDYDNTMLEIE